MEEFDFKGLLKYIWSRFYLVIIIFAASVAAGEFYTIHLQTPEYISSTKLVLINDTNKDITVSDIQISNNLISTYSEIAKSEGVLSKAIDSLNLQTTTSKLRSRVTVKPTSGTQILTISVTDEDPTTAERLANNIAAIFKNEIIRIYKIDNIQIVDSANVPTAPYNINVVKQTIYYAAIGLFLGLGIVVLIYCLDNTVKDSETVERESDLIVIGKIPDMEKK